MSEHTKDVNSKDDSQLSLNEFLAVREANEQMNSLQNGLPVDVGGQEWEKRVSQCPNHSIVARQSTLGAIKSKVEELERSLETKSQMFRRGLDSFIHHLKVYVCHANSDGQKC